MMKYIDFIKEFSYILNQNGIRITQAKLKELFELLSEYVAENIKAEEKIPIKEFVIFDLVEIPPKKLPNGEWSKKQLSVRIRMTDGYKKELKEKLNNK